jgi:hypothetical protein
VLAGALTCLAVGILLGRKLPVRSGGGAIRRSLSALLR